MVLAQHARISGPIDNTRVQVLPHKPTPPALAQRGDEGAVEPSRRLHWITLLFKRTPDQEEALARLAAEQRDPASPNYHKWLSSQEFADRFGLNRDDMGKVSRWLQSEGFHIDYEAQDRDFIAFDGTAGQVRNAFHTEIHRYTIGGEPHYMNASAPSVPQALAEVVLGLRGLNDLQPKPASGGRPLRPDQNMPSGKHYLAPDDIAAIYDIARLYGRGIDGSGQSIVVIGNSNVDIEDFREFRDYYNLPGGDPQTILCCSSDPGRNSSEFEADLDIEAVAAVARKANIIYVYSEAVDSAVSFAIDNNLAPVITESYAFCEPEVAAAGDPPDFWQYPALAASAKGITWLAATGDSGAAGCDPWFAGGVASKGFAVAVPASVPEVTAVGGTEFNEGSGSYWNDSNRVNGASAKGYIPEIAWNESSANLFGLASGGGGVSTYFAKPAWQTGPGVPNDGMRDVPDVSMSAAYHDAYYIHYLGGWGTQEGTSASTPIFAGIVVLLNQYLTESGQGRAGNINPMLYELARTTTNVFHDTIKGDNIVPCAFKSSDCAVGSLGYVAGPGYDLATGLGSVDAYNLVISAGRKRNSTTTTVTASPASILTSGQTQLTATVSAPAGTGTPGGSVTFSAGGEDIGSAELSGSTASLAVLGSQLSTGDNTITGTYNGALGFSGSSGLVNVRIGEVAEGVTFTASPNPVVVDGGSKGTTTLSWNAPGYSQLEILVGSPAGTPMSGALLSSGSLPTGDWVSDGTEFYLVDMTTHAALSSVVVHVSTRGAPRPTTTVVMADPANIWTSAIAPTQLNAVVSAPPGSGTPTGMVTFSAAGGLLGTVPLSEGKASLVVDAGQLAIGTNSMTATYSGDDGFASSSGSVAVVVFVPPSGVSFYSNPNPIVSPNGTGITTLSFNAPGYGSDQLAVAVGSATGDQLATTLGPTGYVRTGDSVIDGTKFFLIDLTRQLEIASLTVNVTRGSWPSAVTFTASPSDIVVSRGPLVGMTTLTWNAPGSSNLVIHRDAPTGSAVTGSLPPSGSVRTGRWVTDGMKFFLVDADSGSSLASVSVKVEVRERRWAPR